MSADTHPAALVTAREAASQLGVSRQTVIRRIQAGELTGHKLGRDWVVYADSVEQAAP